MNPDELADRMRQGEVFHSLRMLPGAWVVLRVDGRGFSRQLNGSTVGEKNELLFQRGINFNEGVDPRDGRRVPTERRRLKVDPELPMKEEYEAWVRRVLEASN